MHEGSLSRRRGSPVSDEIVTLGRGQPSFFERHVKRAMDVVLVLLSLPVVLPIVAIMRFSSCATVALHFMRSAGLDEMAKNFRAGSFGRWLSTRTKN